MPSVPPPSDSRLLLRVAERVSSGIRRPRALAEGLGLESRAVAGAVAWGEWLGLFTGDDELELTRAGLGWVYAGSRRTARFAELVWSHPVLGPMLEAPEGASVEVLARAVSGGDASLTPLAARRRAFALRRALEPALRARLRPTGPAQLGLEFRSSPLPERRRVDLRAGLDESPDAYLLLLRALLDHGEVTVPQVRAILDEAGGGDCPIGGYVAMAVRRGDVRRTGDRLLVTRGAVERADLAESPVTIALSDPDFRAHLTGERPAAARFRGWTRRFFRGGAVETELPRLLFGRPLTSVPVAGEAGPEGTGEPGAFLGQASRRGLWVARSASVTDLLGGLTALNRALRAVATEPLAARLPSAVDRRVLVHGGLLHPGEALPRSIPDGTSLRLRAIRNVPMLAVLVALALLDRRRELRLYRAPLRVQGGRAWSLPVESLFLRLARARDWTVVAGPSSVSWEVAADVAAEMGVLVEVEGRLTLDEGFFHRLQADAEHREVYELLVPLGELLLDRVPAPLEQG